MKVNEAMTSDAQYIAPGTKLREAAEMMRNLDCGFLPISDDERKKLAGVVTDRDITIRAVAEGLNPDTTTVSEIMSSGVSYCFSEDDLESASKIMREKGIYRLIVLDDREHKNLAGVLSLGDVLRHNQESLAASTAGDITRQQA